MRQCSGKSDQARLRDLATYIKEDGFELAANMA